MDDSVDSNLIEQAHGVIAARLEVDAETSAHILESVARREQVSKEELAADVLMSCTSNVVRLPRDLYTNGDLYDSAA